MTSEAHYDSEPTIVFIYSKDTKYERIPKNVTHLKVDPSVKEIVARAFDDCWSLVEVEFSEGLERIGDEGFIDCSNLKYINKLPSTLMEIGDCAFEECESLVEVQFPEGLERIGQGAFSGCSSLTHVRIPSSVCRMEHSAFAECTRLISLELPDQLELIDLGARDIYGCQSLVNLAVPSGQRVVHLADDDEVMEGSKLQYVASNFDELANKLQHRFDDLLLHRLCYYQYCYPLTEAMQDLRLIMDADPLA
jgi:hypothetical protein